MAFVASEMAFSGWGYRFGVVSVGTASPVSGVIRFQFDCRGVVADGVDVIAGVEVGGAASVMGGSRIGLQADGFVVGCDGGVPLSGEHMAVPVLKCGDGVRVGKVRWYLVVYDDDLGGIWRLKLSSIAWLCPSGRVDVAGRCHYCDGDDHHDN